MAERWVLGLPLDIELPQQQPSFTTTGEEQPETNNSYTELAEASANLDQQLDHHEKLIISAALKRNKGQIEQTASSLGIPRKKLYLRMKKYALDRQSFA
jgi:DNA-binding NtrC family response regulator